MRKVRPSIFESNSSMTHSLVILPQSEYEKWSIGDFYIYTNNWPEWNYKLVDKKPQQNTVYSKEEVIQFLNSIGVEPDDDYNDEFFAENDFETYEYWSEDEYCELIDDVTVKTPSGDVMVAVSKCGRDG